MAVVVEVGGGGGDAAPSAVRGAAAHLVRRRAGESVDAQPQRGERHVDPLALLGALAAVLAAVREAVARCDAAERGGGEARAEVGPRGGSRSKEELEECRYQYLRYPRGQRLHP